MKPRIKMKYMGGCWMYSYDGYRWGFAEIHFNPTKYFGKVRSPN